VCVLFFRPFLRDPNSLGSQCGVLTTGLPGNSLCGGELVGRVVREELTSWYLGRAECRREQAEWLARGKALQTEQGAGAQTLRLEPA